MKPKKSGMRVKLATSFLDDSCSSPDQHYKPSILAPDVISNVDKIQGKYFPGTPTHNWSIPDQGNEPSIHEPYVTSSTPKKECVFFPEFFPADIPQPLLSPISNRPLPVLLKQTNLSHISSQIKRVTLTPRHVLLDSSSPMKVCC